MNIVKSLGLMALSTLVVSAFTSCEEHNPFSEKELFQQEYSKNFFKTYGNFPANQSWDFSEQPRTCATDPSVFDLGSDMGTRAHSPEAATEVSLDNAIKNGILSIPTGSDPYYYLEKETYDWLSTHLVEGENNTTIGSPFTLMYDNSPSDNKFAIIPFYQGFGTVKYKLHLVSLDNEADYVIWDNWPLYDGEYNNDAVSQKGAADFGTADFQWNWRDGYPASHTSGNWQNVDKGQTLEGLTNKNVRSKPLIISGLSGEFYLYLEVTQVLSQYGSVGDHHTSKEGMMLAVPCPTPSNINNYKSLFGIDESKTISQVMVIGCEDTEYSDWDMNDISFLIVGLTDLPQRREATHSKRYLIEDLGTTVDFDFNDVVVDVTETVMIDASGNEEIYTQEAVVRHLCGTVPFEVFFTGDGSTYESRASFGTIQGIVQGTNEEYKDESGKYVKIQYTKKNSGTFIGTRTSKPFWDSSNNNISINVGTNGTLTGQDWSAGNGGVNTANFNKPGETKAPYIIAVPTTVMWTPESTNFPIDKVSQYNQ